MGRRVDKPHRFGKHIAGLLAHLRDRGGRDMRVDKAKHFRVTWVMLDGRVLCLRMSCTPRDEDITARFAIAKADKLMEPT